MSCGPQLGHTAPPEAAAIEQKVPESKEVTPLSHGAKPAIGVMGPLCLKTMEWRRLQIMHDWRRREVSPPEGKGGGV